MSDRGAVGTVNPYPAYIGRTVAAPYTVQPKAILNLMLASVGVLGQQGPGYLRCIVAGGAFGARDPLLLSFADPIVFTTHVIRSGRSDSVGNPTPPSQSQGRRGAYKSLVPVVAGLRTISIDVRIVDRNLGSSFDPTSRTPYPRLTVRANPDVGLLAEVVADALGQPGWQTISAAFTATASGSVEVWREKRYMGMDDVVYWDNLRVS